MNENNNMGNSEEYRPFEAPVSELLDEDNTVEKNTLIFLGIIFAVIIVFILILPHLYDFIDGLGMK